MPTVRCDKGHNYDDRLSHCPYCPVPGLRNANIPKTEAALMSRPGIPQTEPASLRGPGAPTRGAGGADRGGTAGVTVGLFQKQTGMEPVVGWLVCIKGTNKGRDYRLHSDLNKLGRAPNMDVCVEGDDTISRENHCQIAFSPRSKAFNVVPGTGRNLIYLNGEDVLTAMRLQAYDRLDLGDSSFLFIPFCTDKFDWESTDKPTTNTNTGPTPHPRNETPVG